MSLLGQALKTLVILTILAFNQTQAVPLESSVHNNSSSFKKNSKIYILRKNEAPKINIELYHAYAAFQRGDNKAALDFYTNILQQEPKNRDALLGLAGLALRDDNKLLAQQYYQQVLELYPQDIYAQVGLINTLNQPLITSESQLKLLLKYQSRLQAPKGGYIYFSLGNIYAATGRWAQAQQAFSQALRYDNLRADYVYNLAVSLDHLNQSQLALAYYKQTLQLVKNQPINFDMSALLQRVETLTNYIEQRKRVQRITGKNE